MNKRNVALIIFAGLLVLSGAVYLFSRGGEAPAGAEELAVCLWESGAKFYGTFWCSYCQAQKRMFGAAADELPYVECSTPDSQGQLPVCDQAGIKAYPTWVFPDGSRMTGRLEMDVLVEKTGC